MLMLRVSITNIYVSNVYNIIKYINTFLYFPVSEKENLVALPTSVKKEENHKREINRDGEKEDKNKRLRKAESKENIQPPPVEKKQVPDTIN